jgi:hypothetical protein
MADKMAVYTVRERGEGKKSFWCRIGSCWPNKDGNGFSITLDAVPIDGRLVVREEQPRDDRDDSPPRRGTSRAAPPVRDPRQLGDDHDEIPF